MAAGEIIVITGAGLGPQQAAIGTADAAGFYPTSLAGVQVTIGGRPAPLLYVQAGEIHAIVPFGLTSLVTQIQNGSQNLAPLTPNGATTNPGIFEVNGQGAIVNQDATINSAANPAGLGSVVSIYATGTGTLASPLADGSLTPLPPPYILTATRPRVFFAAGVEGTVLWSGSAPTLVAGVTQINVRIPATLPAAVNLAAVPVSISSLGNQSPAVLISVK
jgi:uncharacterized protein (TIGR03437 family)